MHELTELIKIVIGLQALIGAEIMFIGMAALIRKDVIIRLMHKIFNELKNSSSAMHEIDFGIDEIVELIQKEGKDEQVRNADCNRSTD